MWLWQLTSKAKQKNSILREGLWETGCLKSSLYTFITKTFDRNRSITLKSHSSGAWSRTVIFKYPIARHQHFHMTPLIYSQNTPVARRPIHTNRSTSDKEIIISIPAVEPVITNVAFDHKPVKIIGLPANTVERGSRHLPNVPKQRWAL